MSLRYLCGPTSVSQVLSTPVLGCSWTTKPRELGTTTGQTIACEKVVVSLVECRRRESSLGSIKVSNSEYYRGVLSDSYAPGIRDTVKRSNKRLVVPVSR